MALDDPGLDLDAGVFGAQPLGHGLDLLLRFGEEVVDVVGALIDRRGGRGAARQRQLGHHQENQ